MSADNGDFWCQGLCIGYATATIDTYYQGSSRIRKSYILCLIPCHGRPIVLRDTRNGDCTGLLRVRPAQQGQASYRTRVRCTLYKWRWGKPMGRKSCAKKDCQPGMRFKRGGKERQEENIRVVVTHALQLAGLIRRHLLRRRAFLVEDVVQAYTNGDGVSHVGNQIGALDAEGQGRVVDVVDEVVHFRGFEVHVAVDGGLRWVAFVVGEAGRVAAEEKAEILVEMGHKPGV